MAQQSGFEAGFEVKATASLDVICREVYAKVPGAIEGYIYDQIKSVIRDFFQRTRVWRRGLGPYTLPSGTTTIGLNPVDSRTNVIMVLSVERNAHPLPRALSNANAVANSGYVRWYVEPYHTLNFSPAPDEDLEDLYVSAVLTPRLLDDNIVPQFVLDQHFEALLAGTLQRLYSEPAKAYTNRSEAELQGMRYRAEVARAISAGNANYGTTQPWRYPTHTR